MERRHLARYLRQLGELGGPDVFLDSLTADEALAAARALIEERDTAAPSGLLRVAEGPIPVEGSSRAASPDPATGAPGDAAHALRELAALASACTRCRLEEGRTHVVFGDGSPTADVVVVGEAPGQEEDRRGLPFVGRAGKLLDLLLLAVGLPRKSVYICNVLKCRPPQNRNPLADEVEACADYLQRQLEIIRPRVLLAVGKFAAQSLAGSQDAIGRLRGRIHAYRGTPLVVTYHPAYLLRSPNMMREAWRDFQLMRTVLDEQS